MHTTDTRSVMRRLLDTNFLTGYLPDSWSANASSWPSLSTMCVLGINCFLCCIQCRQIAAHCDAVMTQASELMLSKHRELQRHAP